MRTSLRDVSTFLLFSAISLIGIFSRISTSEFWTITISNSWFKFSQFEYSILQKPLLTIFLSLFHLIPFINDITHLVLVKFIFSVVGLSCVILLGHICTITGSENANSNVFKNTVIGFLLLLISPAFMFHFSNVRSDQLALLVFLTFTALLFKNKSTKLLIVLLISIPLCGIKELLFIPPGIFLYLYIKKPEFTKKKIFFSLMTILMFIVWIAALNPDGIRYAIDLYVNYSLESKFKYYLRGAELYFFMFAPFYIIFSLFSKKHDRITLAFSIISFYFFIIYLLYPQNFQFFIASIVPFSIIPVFRTILELSKSVFYREFAIFTIVVLLSLYPNNAYHLTNFTSSRYQLEYIRNTADILKNLNLSYLDGVGIYPRANLGTNPCFSSPDDSESNKNCLLKLKTSQSDVVISTSRLLYVDKDITRYLIKDYTQILPNFWIKNNRVDEATKLIKNINADLQPAFILF